MAVSIIGAGPAGLATAYQLTKTSTDVEVFEASSSPGGLAKTIELWGQKVDIGSHRFFSNDRRVNGLWLEVVGRDYRMIDRLSRILYRNHFFHYPLRPFDSLFKLGPVRAASCVASYFKEKIRPTIDDGTFQSWVTRRFGRQLFEIFFKSYSEKLWGIRCDELDSDFAAQRIKKLSLYEAIKNAILPKRGVKHKTLADRFAYPIGGTGMVYERMAAAVQQRGGSVHYKSPVRRVLVENSRATGIELTDGTRKHFDHVVSTMPITLLIERMDGVPNDIREMASLLSFRNTVLVYIHVDAKDLFPDNWIYVHSPDLRMGRISNFRNWVPELYGDKQTTILAVEYWCYDSDPLWGQDEDTTIAMVSDELRRTKLIGTARVLNGKVYPIKRCYPVYDRNYKERLRPVEEFLSGISDLSVIGRYGAFKYNNQDHSILMGILAAENIQCGEQKNNLWGINTDYDNYQESSVITETGLQDSYCAIGK
jgi:protoporphyrinogen oxidase